MVYKRGIGESFLNFNVRDKRAPSIHTHAQIGFLGFPGSRGGLELYYDIDTKQFTWNTARQSKAPEVPKKAAKSFKNTLGMARKDCQSN